MRISTYPHFGHMCVLFCMLIASWAIPAKAQLPAGFVDEVYSNGFTQAIGVTFDDLGRAFTWEKGGRVFVVENGIKSPNPVLDIRDSVGGWRDFGLLCITLDPQFLTNGYIYALYTYDHYYNNTTNRAGGKDQYYAAYGRLDRYTIPNPSAAADLLAADLTTCHILIGESPSTGFPSTHQSHHVGYMFFGTDGTLMATCGDGASYGEEDEGGVTGGGWVTEAVNEGIITSAENIGAYRCQVDFSLSGKMVRIDPATGDGIPSNPLYALATTPRDPQARIWARGFRNPCRMYKVPNTGSLNPADANPGTFIVGDVGWAAAEEFTIIDGPNQNAGWPWFEGLGDPQNNVNYYTNIAYQPGTGTIPPHKLPVVDWRGGNTLVVRGGVQYQLGTNPDSVYIQSNVTGNCSMGGIWYESGAYPAEYHDTYFHVDYGDNWIKNFKFNQKMELDSIKDFLPDGGSITGLGYNRLDGAIYYVNNGAELHRIYYSPTGNQPPVAIAAQDESYSSTGSLTVEFQGDQSYDPEGLTITYAWDFGDGNTSILPNPTHTFTAPGAAAELYTVTLTVTDPDGASHTATMEVALNNTPPVIQSTSLDAVQFYSMVSPTNQPLSAVVTDAETTNGMEYQWQTFLYHDNHNHPEPIDYNATTTTQFSPIGCDDVLYFFRVELTVTDAGGLSDFAYFDVYPNCDGPVTINDTIGYDYGLAKTFHILGNDLDGTSPTSGIDVSTITILKTPLYGTLAVNNTTGEITYTHNGSNSLDDLFLYKVYDNLGRSSGVAQVSLARGGNPAIEIQNPDDQDVIFASDVTLQYAAFGDVPPGTQVELILNGGTPIVRAFTTGAYQFTGLSTANVQHTLVARLIDQNGVPLSNPEASQTITFTTATRPEPGGVATDLAFWVKADYGFAPGITTTWEDLSTNGLDVSQTDATYMPLYESETFNGNPSIYFDGTAKLYRNNVPADLMMTSDEMTIITVQQAVGAVLFGYGVSGGNTKAVLEQCGGRFWFANQDLNNDGAFNAPLCGTPTISTGLADRNATNPATIYANGGVWQTASFTNTLNPAGQNASLHLGGWLNNCCTMTGNLAEVIVYKRALTDAELHAVWSYLAIKYGITIEVASHNFFAHTGFPEDIAGIGRDALVQDLNQTNSRSINAGSMVRMMANHTLADGEYLVWGNDGADLTLETTNIPAAVSSRVGRTWRVDVTQTPGEVTVEIDLASLGVPIRSVSDINLLIDNHDGDFSDATIVPASSLVNDIATFASVDFPDDAYFTLAVEVACLPYCDGFNITGSATDQGFGCYQLTYEGVNSDRGAIWFDSLVYLGAPFRMEYDIFLGNNDSPGADGMTFTLQNQSNVVTGTSNGGLGLGGVTPSLSIEFDTYQNGGEPSYDHISIYRNSAQGQVLAPAVQAAAAAANIEDGVYHNIVVNWDPTTQNLEIYFDGSLRTTYNGDIANTIFGGDEYVFFGFTAATGGETNDQAVCVVDLAGDFYGEEPGPIEARWVPAGSTDELYTGTDCYRLTNTAQNIAGTVWYNVPVSIGRDFRVDFDIMLGDLDAGADGMAFVMHQDPDTTDAVGAAGGGFGYSGINPSVAVEFDTYDNSTSWDRAEDHMAVIVNSVITNPISGGGIPTCIIPSCGNVEDGAYHSASIVWDASTNTLDVIFDGNTRITHTQNFVTDIFGGDTLVYLGFSAATGGATNDQEVCITGLTATLDKSFPVAFLSFNAEPVNQQVFLTWETASEENNDYFMVERSEDGERYEDVVKVQGAGTTQEVQRYQAVDRAPYFGTSYYRLRQVDIDGQVNYSNRIKVILLPEGQLYGLVAYPNPAPDHSVVNLEFELPNASKPTVAVYNARGQQVLHRVVDGEFGLNRVEMITDQWAKGIYLIRVSLMGQTEMIRLVIE